MRPTLFAVPSSSGEAGAGAAQRAGVGQRPALKSETLALLDDVIATLQAAETTLKLSTVLGTHVPHVVAEGVLDEVGDARRLVVIFRETYAEVTGGAA